MTQAVGPAGDAGDDGVSWTMPELPPGTVREVVRAPAEILATAGAAVDPTDPATIALAADLLATQAVSPGCVGLAAQQVGEALRVFSVDVTGHPKTRTCHGAFVLCNAEVLSASRKGKGREGCMSVPDLTGDVARARRLTVRGQLPVTGEWVEIETDAFEAVCLQHEIDHTEGLLFLDRVVGPQAVHRRQTYL
ncbi:peptide deformylase [Desertihabitans aurantiacus]|uniref:peptide deformylase n=1 Tax=Desertihabitans aurantiacus TaxID=2282477 RepID=UPI001E4A49AC|nr:peptide deformylase [Desertihabitans aurantiacus]